MFPQSELENYKLQVELLQEKLKRSEERREQLEEKFEHIMKRRNEHDKVIKTKSRIKYQQFLDEQKERNERNRALVKMLEHVDQHAAILAARSERLKMMKIHYELYFTKVLQNQCLRSIQGSPPLQSQYSVHPLNRFGLSVNNPQGFEDICQTASNLNKGLPLQENIGLIGNSMNGIQTSNMNVNSNFNNNNNNNIPIAGFGTYRFPVNTDILNGPIMSNHGPQNRVNLKSTFGDSMVSSSHGFPNQMEMFADIRNPIDLDHYKVLDPNLKAPYGGSSIGSTIGRGSISTRGDGGSVTSETSAPIKSDKQNRNLNTIQGLFQMNNESVPMYDGRGSGYDHRQIENSQYQISIPDKLQAIKKDCLREKLMVELNDNENNENKVDNDDNESKKSLSMNIENTGIEDRQRRQQIDTAITSKQEEGKKIEDSSREIEPVRYHEASVELPLKDVNRPIIGKPKAPVLWNFSGKIDPLQLKKKEKLSMENIENAIYGERISPINRKVNEVFEPINLKMEKYEQQIPTISGVKATSECVKTELQLKSEVQPEIIEEDEKTDSSEKDEVKVMQDKKQTLEIQEIREEKPTFAEVDEVPDGNYNVYDTSNSYPNQYEQNYDNSYYTDQKSTDPNNSVQQNDGNENTYANYEVQSTPEYSETSQPQQYQQGEQVEYQQSPAENQIQDVYDPNQYHNNEYQYQNPSDYTQNQDYSNYEGQNYQGDDYQQPENYDQNAYDQQTYDPNAYAYNYDQNTEYTGDGNYENGTQQLTDTYVGTEYPEQSYPDQSYQQDYTTPGNEYQVDTSITSGDELQQPNIVSDGNQQYQQEIDPEQKTEETPYKSSSDLEDEIKQPIEKSEEITNNDDTNSAEDEDDVILPPPPVPSVMPPSILSTSEKSNDSPNGLKKKKRVNFVDSETDDSSSLIAHPSKPPDGANTSSKNDDSDFDFSSN